ncbi:flavodoxin family protein [Methanobrevibacter oralis]|uniref:Iron-sulfur flavoprotein n=1 Tax=Methanobrevibacter oralis TaxID=66851 RepID=A0A166BPJ9_METOA|nr:NAD(P)H-dependent oxidoreductase [Methanobrevibacter oralis]KZX13646.1 iron-sulfur flavoprotein [Methanobrevibacter oralis]
MKFYAINGSKREEGNTAQLLNRSLEAIKSVLQDAECEYINLYDIPFNGCKSCFACKRVNGRHYGKCVYKDDFKPILNKIIEADGIVLGSPIYFGDVTGVMRCFLERFIFPFLVYDGKGESLAPKRMPLAFIYTMNATEDNIENVGYDLLFDRTEWPLEMIFTKPYRMYSCDTYQFSDYSKYVSSIFSEEHKAEVRKTQFPKDLKNAYDIGIKIANDAQKIL